MLPLHLIIHLYITRAIEFKMIFGKRVCARLIKEDTEYLPRPWLEPEVAVDLSPCVTKLSSCLA